MAITYNKSEYIFCFKEYLLTVGCRPIRNLRMEITLAA